MEHKTQGTSLAGMGLRISAVGCDEPLLAVEAELLEGCIFLIFFYPGRFTDWNLARCQRSSRRDNEIESGETYHIAMHSFHMFRVRHSHTSDHKGAPISALYSVFIVS